MSILLTTLNARFSHASLGLRYLAANMGNLQPQTEIHEFTISQNAADIVEVIVGKAPKILGIGVYIWNINECTALVKELKILRPEIIIILGGPEVSYEYENTEIFKYTDHLITGWGDISFPALCRNLWPHFESDLNQEGKDCLLNKTDASGTAKVIQGIQPKLEDIVLPYEQYTEDDLKNRTIYVEASRGCPFKCEFCLSSLDKTAWSFPLASFMAEMNLLYEKGLRQFKFVDRTFNLKQEFTSTILNFFLDKIAENPQESLFLHFELVPDYLSDALKALILKFPEGALQFEIGIQTLNPETQQLISRKTDLVKAKENIEWLSQKTSVHLHVDLIAGLPAETMQIFAKGFNELWSWNPSEIQLGVLKRLKGTPITRHTDPYQIKYSLTAPYSILESRDLSFDELNQLKRIAKYWDLVANSGRFKTVLPFLLSNQAFENMDHFSSWLYAKLKQIHSISLDKLFAALFEYLVDVKQCSVLEIQSAMQDDFMRMNIQGWPNFLGEQPEFWKKRFKSGFKHRDWVRKDLPITAVSLPKRQMQHLAEKAEIST